MKLVKIILSYILVYHPDMPKRLPFRDLVLGILQNAMRAVRLWLHYTIVALAWLGIVPLSACTLTSLYSQLFSAMYCYGIFIMFR